MSCNYADGLSAYEYKGKLGLPEIIDEPEDLRLKIELLAAWINKAKHVVAHTGAGISTAAGIPDFRGPNGVWTLEKKGQKPVINTSFDAAVPTVTHMVLKGLLDSGKVKFIISQNIDGLHLRSGVKRTNMAELHGNMFVSKCGFCGKFFIQSNPCPTVGEKEIGQGCPARKHGGRQCRGKLIDTLLDWEANLPEFELETAILHSSIADLSICMGTTLQIVPAGNLPLRAKKNPDGKLVIINLQPTKHDKEADLIIHAKVDEVMAELARIIGSPLLDYSMLHDPTKILRNNSAVVEWTIPISSVKRLRTEVAAIKREASLLKTSSNEGPVKRKKAIPTETPSELKFAKQEVPVKEEFPALVERNIESLIPDSKPTLKD